MSMLGGQGYQTENIFNSKATIKHLEMVAEIFPYFESGKLPPSGKKNL